MQSGSLLGPSLGPSTAPGRRRRLWATQRVQSYAPVALVQGSRWAQRWTCQHRASKPIASGGQSVEITHMGGPLRLAAVSQSLSRPAKALVQSILRGREGPAQWLKRCAGLNAQELLDVAWDLHQLQAQGRNEAAHEDRTLLACRQVLLVLENRPGELADQVGAISDAQAVRLMTLLASLNQPPSPKQKQPCPRLRNAHAVASARLRWPRLLAWACERALAPGGAPGAQLCAATLAALASAAHPTHPDVLLALAQGMTSSLRTGPGQQDDPAVQDNEMAALTIGLRSLASLVLVAQPGQLPDLQAWLEETGVALGADGVAALPPVTLRALCEASTALGCVPSPEVVQGALTAALAATAEPDAGVQSCYACDDHCVAAATVVPFVAGVDGAAAMLQQLLDRIARLPVALGPDQDADGGATSLWAFLHALRDGQPLRDAEAVGAIVSAVIGTGRHDLCAHAARCLAASGVVARPAATQLLAAVTPALDRLPAHAVLAAAVAVGELGFAADEYDTGQILPTASRHLRDAAAGRHEHAASPVPLHLLVLEIAAAFRAPSDEQRGAIQDITSLAVAALQYAGTAEGGSQPSLPPTRRSVSLVAGLVAEPADGGVATPRDGHALLTHAAALTPWMSPAQLVQWFQAAAATGSGATVDESHSSSVAAQRLPGLQAASLSTWGVLAQLSDPDICEMMCCFGRLGWRPGLMVEDMLSAVMGGVERLATAPTAAPPHLTLRDAVRLCRGVASLRLRGPAARSVLRAGAVAVLAAAPDATPPGAVPSLTASSWDSQQVVLAAAQGPGAPPAEDANNADDGRSAARLEAAEHLDMCVTLLWAYGRVGAARPTCIQALRGLVWVIMGHDAGCTSRQLGLIWQAAVALGLTGARLGTWLLARTIQQLEYVLAGLDEGTGRAGVAPGTAASLNRLLPAASLVKMATGVQRLLRAPPPPVLHDLLARGAVLHARAGSLSPSQLVQVVYALAATLPPRPDTALAGVLGDTRHFFNRLLQLAAQRLNTDPAGFPVTYAVHLVWALAKLGARVNGDALRVLESRLACAPVCIVAPTKAEALQLAAEAAGPRDGAALARVDDSAISQYLWAASVCGHPPSHLAATYATALPSRLARHYQGGRDARDSAGIVAAGVAGLGAAHHPASPAELAALEDAAVRYHQFLDAAQLSMLLYGFAQLRHCPKRALRLGLTSAARRTAKAMGLQELTNAVWALAQWPLKEVLGLQALEELRAAFRPVLLVHVLGVQVSASASYDAAGEPTAEAGPQAFTAALPAVASLNEADVAAAPPGAPGIPFGRPSTAPPALQSVSDLTATLPVAQPPLAASSIANLAVGVAGLGMCTPGVAEAIASWALSEGSGGLARFGSRQLCLLLWAFATVKYDRLSLFEGAGEVLVARAAAGKRASSTPSGGPSPATALTTRDVQKLLWAWAQFNRHPGEELLDAAKDAWAAATASRPPPADELCSCLYALAIFREHRHPLTVLLVGQLAVLLGSLSGTQPGGAAAWVAGGPLPQPGPQQRDVRRVVLRHGPQLAACLLAAQAEQQESPLLRAIPPDLTAKVLEAWQGRAAARVTKKRNHYVSELRWVATGMGLTHEVAVSSDGMCCPDLTVTLPFAPQLRFALELVGPHNAASNSGRLLGAAALKYRLLQARGYLVVPISCKEWDALERTSSLQKVVYLQDKLDARLAALTGASGPTAAVGAPGGPPLPPPMLAPSRAAQERQEGVPRPDAELRVQDEARSSDGRGVGRSTSARTPPPRLPQEGPPARPPFPRPPDSRTE